MEYLYGNDHGHSCPHEHKPLSHSGENKHFHSHDGHHSHESENEEELSPYMQSVISHVEEHIISKRHQGKENSQHEEKGNYHVHSEEHHAYGHLHHEHRNLHDVLSIIDNTQMTDGAKKLACRIFEIIAEAESKAHAKPVGQVHFHEVGAIDSIVDVIALAVCYDNLQSKYGFSEVYIPSISEGTGTVRCQHGVLPVPVPAVVNISAEYGLPLCIIQSGGELATPTGMAFAAALYPKTDMPPAFKIISAGMGAGKREYGIASIVRAMIIEPMPDKTCAGEGLQDGGIYKLETNIDDCSAEALGFAIEQLFENGAKDAYFTPCYMKKCRPAYMVSVICSEDKVSKMEEIIFANTSTIGIRRIKMERTALPREIIRLKSPYGEFSAKSAVYGGLRKIAPEYEEAAEIAKRTGKPFAFVYAELQEICGKAADI